jgi:hypothetical protein
VPAFSSSMQYPPERQERTSRRDPSNAPFLSRDAIATVLWASSLFSISLSARWALQRGTENCHLGNKDTYQCPASAIYAWQSHDLKRNRRPTTNQIHFPLFTARGNSLSDTGYESDVRLSKPALAPLQNSKYFRFIAKHGHYNSGIKGRG